MGTHKHFGQLDTDDLDVPPGGGSSFSRDTVTITTASLAPAVQETGTVVLAPGFRLLRIEADAAARLRLYTTEAKRDADMARLASTPPGFDSGVLFDFISTVELQEADLSPLVDGWDAKTVPDGEIGYTIDNHESVPTVVAITLTFIAWE